MRIFEITNEPLDEGKFNITVRDARKILKDLGFTYARDKGDHEQWVKPGERTFPLQVKHKDLPGYAASELLFLMKKHNYKLK